MPETWSSYENTLTFLGEAVGLVSSVVFTVVSSPVGETKISIPSQGCPGLHDQFSYQVCFVFLLFVYRSVTLCYLDLFM